MPSVTLTYEDGTVGVAGTSEESLPGVETDDRSGTRRAAAYRYPALRDALREAGHEIDDHVLDLPELPPLDSAYSLREYQREALDAWEANDRRGVLELPTGSGKTVIALAAIAATGTPALVVVPTVDLLEQWHRELSATFDVPVGRLGGGEQTVEALTVATYDSAYLRADELGDRFGLLVLDEVHHLGGEGYRDIARLFAAPARLGLTATFERPDGAHEAVAELVGPVVYDLDPDDLAGEHLADYEVRRVEVELTDAERERYEEAQGTFLEYVREVGITFRSGSDYQELVKRSGNDPRAREALLAKQRAREVMMNADAKLAELSRILDRHRGERVIVFTAHTALVYRISERFLIPAITAETGTEERREILSRFRDGTYSRVVAANVLDEGVDVPEASVGVILSGSGSEREFTQRLGRILRPGADGAKTATLYELVTNETAEERVARRRR
ncbi:DEAD/DEAH box helicase [Halobaculum rubrum]|uniref:DEAD/DEAH box helicase n=1 Tax=Halobaculum rubrum TaxID=2872158 RepID=UPI001CA3CA9E|nr:DEAD/DEAH box helicase family protein [Halobaculum rubrum]QZX98874.1 DEAD/DEAH box helicase family protein [Halobaculum rubrum]